MYTVEIKSKGLTEEAEFEGAQYSFMAVSCCHGFLPK